MQDPTLKMKEESSNKNKPRSYSQGGGHVIKSINDITILYELKVIAYNVI